MERKNLIFFFIICALLLGLSISLKLSPTIKWKADAGISPLPDNIGIWKGNTILYCQNIKCGHSFDSSVIGTNKLCPDCGAPLAHFSIAEKTNLPKGTIIKKKRYSTSSGPDYFVSVVLSTKERRSIHQPQVCLKGQGYLIIKQRIISINVGKSKPLKVEVLDLQPSPNSNLHPATFAYWFSSRDKETPSGWQRLIWIMQDRIIHNTTHQWAYIGIMTSRRNDSDKHILRLKRFISELYPQIINNK